MAYENPSGSFVHAALYAQLQIQVSEHLFPEEKLFSLSADQRRIVTNETNALLLQSRWQADSKAFAEQFAGPLAGMPEAPEGTVLGRPVGSSGSSVPGNYA